MASASAASVVPASPWGIPGVLSAHVEVQTAEKGWQDVRDAPLEGGIPRCVLLPSLDARPVCTLAANERYRVLVKPAAGYGHNELAVDLSVDGISAWGARCVPAEGLRFEGFHDQVANTMKAFCAKEIEVVEGTSIRAAAAAQDAMDRAGKIVIKAWPIVVGEERETTYTVKAEDGKKLETTAKKALINGLCVGPLRVHAPARARPFSPPFSQTLTH